MTKHEQQRETLNRLQAALAAEDDLIAALATVACELFHGFAHFHWVGFYRVVREKVLKIGPYQGTHGCATIPFDRGVCGACARTGQTQVVSDVSQVSHHIACSHTTCSEIVVPVRDAASRLVAVLDVDSNHHRAFDDTDVAFLEAVARLLAQRDW